MTERSADTIRHTAVIRRHAATVVAVLAVAAWEVAARYLLIVPSRGLLGRPAWYDLLPLSFG